MMTTSTLLPYCDCIKASSTTAGTPARSVLHPGPLIHSPPTRPTQPIHSPGPVNTTHGCTAGGDRLAPGRAGVNSYTEIDIALKIQTDIIVIVTSCRSMN